MEFSEFSLRRFISVSLCLFLYGKGMFHLLFFFFLNFCSIVTSMQGRERKKKKRKPNAIATFWTSNRYYQSVDRKAQSKQIRTRAFSWLIPGRKISQSNRYSLVHIVVLPVMLYFSILCIILLTRINRSWLLIERLLCIDR